MALKVLLALLLFVQVLVAEENPIPLWSDLAPGETSASTGEEMPLRPNELPPITRLVNIRKPTMQFYRADGKPNGTAVVILPGGGFGKVVPDLEGSEAAERLNKLGITAFVVNYRTNEAMPKEEPNWKRPLQDAQRAMRLVRANAEAWNIDPNRVGVLAFSAGGQVGAMLITAEESHYEPKDETDKLSFRPDFAMLIYPWQVLQPGTEELLAQIKVTKETPPTFLVHTHDDNSSSIGALEIYAAMKRNKVPAELHVYENGGHGYGIRPRPNSNIGTWIDRAEDWLR
ncbi:MAG: alpha/beta hydrolase, partial [Planctomicrobium sp.]|nr:alpha/beta hydrolase [Planctomicrobium sp.]